MPVDTDPLRSYVVHFTRGNDPDAAATALAGKPADRSLMALLRWLRDIDDTGYQSSLSILWEGFVRPTDDALGIAAVVSEVKASQCSACFSATRLDGLAQLIETRSSYGVGFRQDVLAAAGGGPVRYLSAGNAEVAKLTDAIQQRQQRGIDPDDPFWLTTPFIDGTTDNMWEDEWRVPGGFAFEPADVEFVFLPEQLHGNARAFFAEHFRENTGPSYLCRYVDPTWSGTRIKRVLSAPVPLPPETEPFVPSTVSPFAAAFRRP